MDIIRFPGKPPKKPQVEATKEHRLTVAGPICFSCDCGTVSEIGFKNVVFRHIEFYCSNCGTNYRVTNPAFARGVPKPPQRK